MATNITEEHLHHMAKRHHHTMKKLDGLREKFAGITSRFIGTLEVSAGAWVGAVVEGRTSGGTVLHVPINLGVGALLIAAGHLDLAGEQYNEHLNNLGNGFVASYVAATGYSFGKRWHDTGKLFGPKAAAAALPAPSPVVQGELSAAQMASIVEQMQRAAAGAHP